MSQFRVLGRSPPYRHSQQTILGPRTPQSLNLVLQTMKIKYFHLRLTIALFFLRSLRSSAAITRISSLVVSISLVDFRVNQCESVSKFVSRIWYFPFDCAQGRPWRIATAIVFRTKDKAIEFEKYLKSHSGRAVAKKHS